MRLSRRREHSADRGVATELSPASASRSCAPWLLADGCCSGCDHLHAARNSTWLLLLQPRGHGAAHGSSSRFIAFAGSEQDCAVFAIQLLREASELLETSPRRPLSVTSTATDSRCIAGRLGPKSNPEHNRRPGRGGTHS